MGVYASKVKVIENPSVDVKRSGIYEISKIELSPKETRLYIHCTFVPHWWITFSKSEDIIKDCKTGKTYEPIAMEGGEFDKYVWMPDSGDSTIVLVYPPLDKSLEKFDFGKNSYGVSLKPSANKAGDKKVVSAEVMKWLETEVNKPAPKKSASNSSLFQPDTARLVGYIKGYDPRLGFSTGIIYTANDLTREDFPTVIEIQPDGRFDIKLPVAYLTSPFMLLNEYPFQFYIAPGQTLGVVLDWEDFLQADRQRNIRYKFKYTQFLGSLATLNKEMSDYNEPNFDYKAFREKTKTVTPREMKTELGKMLSENMAFIINYIQTNAISPQTATLLRNNVLISNAMHCFDYIQNRSYEAYRDTANAILKLPVESDFYDFLKNIPFKESNLLSSSGFTYFVNRLEFSQPLMNVYKKSKSVVIDGELFIKYLADKNIAVPDSDKQVMLSIFNPKHTMAYAFEVPQQKIQQTITKYNKHVSDYVSKLNGPKEDERLQEWVRKDSVMANVFGLKDYQTILDIIKVRSLASQFKHMPKEDARAYWKVLKAGIADPYLIQEGSRLLDSNFPLTAENSYNLPQGKATDIFNKIVGPFKGKIVFVDFWATTCGPCVGGIREMKENREKYKNDPDIDFVFITDVRQSPQGDYNKMVEEQQMKNTFRISTDDFNYLRQLFKFNGIPHYVVIGKKGEVIDDHFEMYNFERNVQQIIKSVNTSSK
jgi:thiol-disulfide isomerase/thioredoxin